LIGTHRLVSKDIVFKDLGLLVVDEEQRFGVSQKEKIKGMKKNVDVLTLSATPIPRTLHMSLTGVRDISVIETPPEDRYPIQTYVVEQNDQLIRDAILREISRDGQVYFVYNRVQNIDSMANYIRDLVPECKVGIMHGKMTEKELETEMIAFMNKEYDVLVCTTIIETGIDISKLNIIYRIGFIYIIELIPLIGLILIYKKDLKKDLNDFKPNIEKYADKYIKYWLLGIFLMGIANIIISTITKTDNSSNETAIREITKILPIYSIMSTCIVAPIAEELAFRKTVNNIFINKKLSIFMGFLLFGLAHVVGTYSGLLDLLYIIPYGILGGIFMYIYTDSENIFTTITLHFIHNTILMILYFISGAV